MQIVDFSIEALFQCQMWYLTKHSYETVSLMRPSPVGMEPYTKATAYRMFNGRVVIGFHDLIHAYTANGLILVGDGVSEYITTQVYERVSDLLGIVPPNNDLGTFGFTDSQPILVPDRDWRCDYGSYGPHSFEDAEGNFHKIVGVADDLIRYEPIVSYPGIAHLIYLHRKDFGISRNEYVNNALTPMTVPTLGETLRLIYEWAEVSNDPFNNMEEIALDARKFIEKLGVTEIMVQPYPAMQIYRYLQGMENARVRPTGAPALSDELRNLIKNQMCRVSLADIVSEDRGLWDLWDLAEHEVGSINEHKKSFVESKFKNLNISDFSSEQLQLLNIPRVPEVYLNYVVDWVKVFESAQQISKIHTEM